MSEENLETFRFRKIGEDSDEYRVHQEGTTPIQQGLIQDSVLGSREVLLFEGIQGSTDPQLISNLKLIGELPEDFLGGITDAQHEILGRSRSKLAQKLEKSPPSLGYALIYEALQKPQLRIPLLRAPLPKGENALTPELLSDPLVVSDELYLALLKNHQEVFLVQSAEYEKALPEMRDIFLRKALELAKSGRWPVHPDLIKKRLSGPVQFIDGLGDYTMGHEWGMFNSDKNLISLVTQVPDKYRQGTYNHEGVHALGGRTIVKVESDQTPNRDVFHLKLGLQLYNDYTWLNEAQTEELAAETGEEAGSYESNRRLRNLLLVKGKFTIPEDIVRNAYFENFDMAGHHKLPHTRRMFAIVGQAYRPGFLPQLDRFVDTHGVDEAVTLMEVQNGWQSITP